MPGQERNKSLAFVTLYLSGVSKGELLTYPYFSAEVENSEELALLSEVENAHNLHLLSSLRRHIYQNFKEYREVKSPDSASFLLPDTDALKENGILDAYGVFTRNYNISDLFNTVTVEINKLLEGVLEGFNFPFIEEVKALFYFPKKMTLKELAEYMSKASKFKSQLQFSVPIFRFTKIERYLQTIYYLDSSIVITSHVLTGKKYNMVDISEDLKEKSINWENLKNLREKRLLDEKEKELELELEREKEEEEKEKAQKEQEQVTLLETVSANKTIQPLRQQESVIVTQVPVPQKPLHVTPQYIPLTNSGTDVAKVLYVDCDNINVFNFLALLEEESMVKDCESTVIKLYLDSMANPIWNVVQNIVSDKYTIVSIPVSRIKQEKSVVDIVLTADITKDYSMGYGQSHVIVSSDSDFYGIFVSGVEATVLYESAYVSPHYLSYLSRENVFANDISKNHSSSRNVDYKKKIVCYLGLIACTEIALSDLTLEALTVSMYEKYKEIERNTSELVTGNFIDIIAKEILSGYQVVSSSQGHIVSAGSVSYLVPYKK